MAQFHPKQYWEDRLSRNYSLDGVGWQGLGTSYNRWLYRVRRRAFLGALAPHARQLGDGRVLDVGSGTGFYIDRWKELGIHHICGCDLTDFAIAQLRRRYPACSFHVLDIGDALPEPPAETFDAVSCMDVLFHIMDDQRYRTAYANFGRLVKPGGLLVLTECRTADKPVRATHMVLRLNAEREALLREAGFDILIRRPVFMLMVEPYDTQRRVLRLAWSELYRTLKWFPRLAGPIGAALYWPEVVITSLLRQGSSHELIVARRR